MSTHWASIAAVGLALGIAPATTAFASGHDEAGENEREVPLASIPAPARDALVARAAGAPIL
jgi:hypothetical protein